MAKITAELEAFYGYGCGFQSYGSEDTIELEVSDIEFDALKKFEKNEITAEDVVKAIEAGDTTLESLHDKLSDEFYYMVEEYWLYEADNECLYECLEEHITQDIEDGLYSPIILEDDDEEDLDEEDYDDDDEDYDDEEVNYDLDAYYDWVKEHDHEFVAERVGLDLDACRDDEVVYKIIIE